MRICDKCESKDGVATVHLKAQETTRSISAHADLCEECRDGLTGALQDLGFSTAVQVSTATPPSLG